MILPTKGLCEERSLLMVGGEVLSNLNQKKTLSRLWDDIKESHNSKKNQNPITYDWFILTLDMLYLINIIDIEDGVIRRTNS